MWTFTEDGFFSTVEDYVAGNEGGLLVRGRDVKSLERFCVETKTPLDWIQTTPERDYPFRVSVPREVWAEYVQSTARDIDYNDFKSHCKALASYAGSEAGLTSQQLMAMGMVWAVMYGEWAERP